MATMTATTRPLAAPAPLAARLSMVATATFLIVLAALHRIKPEIDPSWHLASEYAIGRLGWLMALAFLTQVLGYVSLVVAIRPYVRTIGGRIGLAFLLATAVGMTIAALFTADPLNTSQDQLTTHGAIHGVGALLGIPSGSLAAMLVSRSLVRHPAWSPARRPLIWTAGLAWLSFAAFILAVAVLLPRNGGQFGPEVPIGWVNRATLLANGAWLLTVAGHALRARGQAAATDPAGQAG